MSEDNLPPGWALAKFEDLLIEPKADLVDGPFGSNLRSSEYIESGVPVLKIQNIKADRFVRKHFSYVSEEKAAELSRHSFVPGDLMITKLGAPLGLCCEVPKDFPAGVFVADLMRLRLRTNKISKRFVLLAINSQVVQNQFKQITKGTTRPRVNLTIVRSLEMPLPPLPEQKRIVAKIEELFSELEAGEESLRLARRQLGVYRQSLLKQAFEGKLTAKWRTQNPGKASSSIWREVGVSEVLISKPTNGRSVKDRAGGFKVLRLTALKNGVIDLSEHKEGDWDAAEAATHVVRKGNFLLSRGNGSIRLVGRGGIVREDADIAFPDTMIRLPLDLRLVDPLFFSYLWNSHQVRQQIESSARTTAGIYKINQALLTRYRVPLCSLPEQQEIVRFLDAQFEVIERNEREIDGALRKSEALRQSILKKAFTGRLVPQSPADEPASALLARLKSARTNETNMASATNSKSTNNITSATKKRSSNKRSRASA